MFEEPQLDKQETKKMRMLIGIALVVVLVIVAVIYFAMQPKSGGTAATSTQPTAKCEPEPIKDLKIEHAKMDKDPTGTWAVWAVSLQNKSAGCTYTNLEYETTYLRGDDTVLIVNKGTLPGSIAPGETKDFPELRDALYPTGMAWYRFKMTGAKVVTP